jgi:ribonuclease HI
MGELLVRLGKEWEQGDQDAGYVAYADDLVIYVEEGADREGAARAERKLNNALGIVGGWGCERNMKISTEKTTYSIFSRGKEEVHELNLSLAGEKIQHEKSPKYLGMVLDQELDFGEQVNKTLTKCRRRLGAIRRLAGASWKPRTRHIKMLYTAVVESVLHYGAGVWGSRLGAKAREKIDRFQAEAAGIILGVRVGTDAPALMAEAGLLPIEKVGEAKAAGMVCRAWSKVDKSDPLLKAVEDGCRWGEVGAETMERAGCRREQVLPEWTGGEAGEDGTKAVDWIIKGRLKLVEEEAMETSVEEYHSLQDQVWYTDGSVKGRVGGSGWVKFSRCEKEEGCVAFREGGRTTGKAAVSYTAEQEAILAALEDLTDKGLPEGQKIALLTDSLSNVMSLGKPGARDEVEAQILGKACELCEAGNELTMRFIRGHVGHVGNEMADESAGKFSGEGRDVGLSVDCRFAKMVCEMGAAEEHREDTKGLADASGSGKLRHLKCISQFRASPLICSGSGKMHGGRVAEKVFSRLRTGKDLMGLECGCGDFVKVKGEHANVVKHILYECPGFEEYRGVFQESAEKRWKEEVAEMAKRQPNRIVVNPWGKTSILHRAPNETLNYIQECLSLGQLKAGSTRSNIMELAKQEPKGDSGEGGGHVGGEVKAERKSLGGERALLLDLSDEEIRGVMKDDEIVGSVKEELRNLEVRGLIRRTTGISM